MHGSLHVILAHESARGRHTSAGEARRVAAVRRPLSALLARVAAAHGIPARAAPGTDPQPLGRRAAPLRGR
jgi:hypothetical protein